MNLNVTAILEAIKDQQKQFMECYHQQQKLKLLPKLQVHYLNLKVSTCWKKSGALIGRLQKHFICITSAIKKERSFLLSCLDLDTYALLKILFEADNVTEKSFNVLVEKQSTHFKLSSHIQAAYHVLLQLQNATWTIVSRVGSFAEGVCKKLPLWM